MPNENLLKYIRDGFAMGRTEDILRVLCTNAGWAAADIDAAFAFIKNGGSAAATQNPAAADSMPTGLPISSSPVQPVAAQASQIQPPGPQPGSQPSTVQPVQPSPVQPSMQTSATPTASDMAPKTSKKKWPVVVAIIIAIAIIGGGGWFVYADFLAQPSPESAIAAMFDNKPINSANTDIEFSISAKLTPNANQSVSDSGNPVSAAPSGLSSFAQFTSNSPIDLALTGDASGTYVKSSAGNPDVDANWAVSLNYAGSGQSMTFAASGETRAVDKVVYLKLNMVPAIGAIFNLNSLQGKWIEIPVDSSTAAMAQGISSNLLAPASPSTPSLTPPTLTPEDMQKIMDAAKGALQVTKTLPSGEIGGVGSYHYAYAVNKAGIENLLTTIESIASSSIASSTGAPLLTRNTDIQTANDGIAAMLSGATGEVWIGKNDHYPYEISLEIPFSTSTLFGMVNGTFNVTTTMGDINGGQTVTAPSQSESIQSLFQDIFGSTSSGSGSGSNIYNPLGGMPSNTSGNQSVPLGS